MHSSSGAAASSSDESSIEPSTRPTSPELSPQIFPQPPENALHAQLADLAVVPASGSARKRGTRDLSESLNSFVVKKVCVVGAGYVGECAWNEHPWTVRLPRDRELFNHDISTDYISGGPTAAVMALHNPDIEFTVVDKWESRIRRWKSGHLPIHEPGLREVVRIVRDGAQELAEDARNSSKSTTARTSSSPTNRRVRKPNLFFSTDCSTVIAESDLIMLAVNTPTKTSGLGAGHATDLSALESSVREIAECAKPNAILVEKSTVPCGTAQLIQRLLAAARPAVPFEILSNPEFLSEGTAIKNLQSPDRVLIGSADSISGLAAAAALADLYASWVPRDKILGINVWSSELAKLVANAMLAQRISSINSIAALCETTGANVQELARAVGTDARIGPKFLQAGIGFGGSCFRKDISSLVYISRSLGLPEVGDYWQQVLTMNNFQRSRFARKVISRLNNTLVGKKVTLLGFAYKKNTGDTRESPAVDIIQILLDELPTELAIYDPCCSTSNIEREIAHLPRHHNVTIYTDPYAACAGASALLIVTEWDMFRNDGTAPSVPPPLAPKVLLSDTPVLPPPSQSPILLADVAYRPAPEPECGEDCPDCAERRNSTLATPVPNSETRLDWVRIAHRLIAPRYVLDGKGVLDLRGLGKLGVLAEGLGRCSGDTVGGF